MTRIQLEDGRIIEFEKTPSQQDIEEAVTNLGVKTTPRETGSLSFLRPQELVQSIVDSTKEEFGAATKDIESALEREKTGEQGKLRTAVTTIAQGAQAGLSSVFRGLFDVGSAALPDFIEDPLRRKLGEKFDDFIDSDAGKMVISGISKISDKLDTLDPKNRQLVRDVGDSLMTAVDIGTFTVGGKATKRGLAEVGERAGKAGEELVEKSTREEIAGARKKLADMIIDDTTPSKRTAIASRTTEGGFFSGRVAKATRLEESIVDELLTTQGIRANRSALFNHNAVTAAIRQEAESLVSALKGNNFVFSKQELGTRLRSTLDDIKTTDTDVIGEAEKLADRIYEKMNVFIAENKGNALGALKARKDFDNWVKTKRPKAFEKTDAFNTITRSARDTVNDFLSEKATKVDVKRSLQRQSRLMRAQDVLGVKAGKEAPTGLGRLIDRSMLVLGRKNQVVQILATVAGIGGLGAAAAFAPAVAVSGAALGIVAGLIKLARSPAGRKKLGQLLLAIEKILPKAKGEQKAILEELKDEIKALIDDTDISAGLSIEDVSKKKINNAIDSLAKEARKYKSAEELATTYKKAIQDWKPKKGSFKIGSIPVEDTNFFPRATQLRKGFEEGGSFKFWVEELKKGKPLEPVIVEPGTFKTRTGTPAWFVRDGVNRIAAAEEVGIRNVPALILEKSSKDVVRDFTKFTPKELDELLTKSQLTEIWKKANKSKK